MTGKTNVQQLTLLRNSEIRFAIKARLRFDEVHAFDGKPIDGRARFSRGLNDDGRLVGRRIAIEIGPGEENLRPKANATRNFNAQTGQVFDVTAHIADSSDAVGEKKRDDELATATGFAGACEVNVHVGKTGDQEFTGSIENLRAPRNSRRAIWSKCGDSLVDNNHRHVLSRLSASRVNDGNVSDRQNRLARGGT